MNQESFIFLILTKTRRLLLHLCKLILSLAFIYSAYFYESRILIIRTEV